MLTTNMIRKELNSQNQYEAGLALTSLSCYISTDLARDLSNDVLTLVSEFLILISSLHLFIFKSMLTFHLFCFCIQYYCAVT